MVTKKTLLQQYSKYLERIKQCNDNEIPTNFKKFMDFNDQNRELDNKLWLYLCFDCIHSTLAQVRKRNLRLKDISKRWNPIEVQKCYKLINLLNKEEDSIFYSSDYTDSYKVNFYKFWSLVTKQTDACLQLYMLLVHEDSDDGRKTYCVKEEIKSLMLAETEEDIDNVLNDLKEEEIEVEKLEKELVST